MAYTTIKKPSDYFETELWSSVDTSIDTLNFQPDFAWIKSRTNADSHVLFDAVRGANKRLTGASTSAESTTSDELTAFNSNGYTLGTGDNVNRASNNYVSWNWLGANGTSANTDGSISSTVSVNTTSGFSIVSYTGNGTGGATVGHGLGEVPKWYFVKRRDSGPSNWHVYHASNAPTEDIRLNLAEAVFTTDIWNDTAPTSSVFSLGSSVDVNASGGTYIAYCFSEKTGYSKFSSYVGNNSSDGPFVYTGFKPAWILVKATNSAQWWTLLDNKRDSYNLASLGISPNSSDTESTFNTNRGPHYMDFLSNGFKLRTDSSGVNGTLSFIYMAFAEEPLVGDNPATAR